MSPHIPHPSKRVVLRYTVVGVVLLLVLASFTVTGAPYDSRDRAEEGRPLTRSHLVDVPYQYPLTPGTAAWAKLESHDAMVAAARVPQAHLDRMTTEALVETALAYPLFGDMWAYNTMQQGFDAITVQSNAVGALLARPDAGAVLLARYDGMQPEEVKQFILDEEQGAFSAHFTYVETLLAQRGIQSQLTAEQRELLAREAKEKAEAKVALADIFGGFGVERSALIVGRLLPMSLNDSEIDSFIRDGGTLPYDKLEILLHGAGLDRDESQRWNVHANDYCTSVKTPRGSNVVVWVFSNELSLADRAWANTYVAMAYPQAVRETAASRKYNCHSYAWHDQSTSNTAWMNSPGDDVYWTDGSYTLIQRVAVQSVAQSVPPATVPNGAKVSYLADHSAIKASSTHFRSKWGQLPRMLHKPHYCPYTCTNCTYSLSYYKRR